jgi:uncharacterized repeat protein (TIGR02543 family)
MIQVNKTTSKNVVKRVVAVLSAISFGLTGALGVSAPANADEMAPVINFDGNILAVDFVHSEKGERLERYQLALDPRPISRVTRTDRPGYTFGGWSYAAGDQAVSSLQSSSYTSERVVLYAVWNTKLSLDTNGARAGRLAGGESTVDYRFGQELTLPTRGTIKKRGFSFAGWTLVRDSGPITKTYRAASDAVGNPTLYAAWTKTINFKSRGSVGTVPASITYLEGGERISLPTLAQTSLTRAGYDFIGWSTKPNGKPIKKATSYLPKKKSITLHAVWKKN